MRQLRPSASHYYPELDGLRAIAIANVVLWHLSLRIWRLIEARSVSGGHAAGDFVLRYIPHGEVGVELFFALSGFILAVPIFRKEARSIDIPKFYLNRLSRLYPPYLLICCLSLLGVMISSPTAQEAPRFATGEHSVLASFFASLLYLNGLLWGVAPKINPPLWSLEIEIQFYAMMPILMAVLLTWIGPKSRLMLWVLAFISAAAMALNALLFGHEHAGYAHWNLLGFLHVFILGVIAAYLHVNRQIESHVTFDLLFLVSLVVVMVAGVAYNSQSQSVAAIGRLAMSFSAAICIFSLVSGKYAKLALSSWLPKLGLACYSIYLVHVPVLQVTLVIARRLANNLDTFWLAFSYAVAALVVLTFSSIIFFVVFERPFMDKSWPQRVRSVLTRILTTRAPVR